MREYRYLDELTERYPALRICREDIVKSYEILRNTYENNGKVLIAGNGGSAADSEHIVGELMKGFVRARPLAENEKDEIRRIGGGYAESLCDSLQKGLPAISLTGHPALTTAFQNDVSGEPGMAQQTYAYGTSADVFWGITTSGNSKNIVLSAIAAKAKGMRVIALTGRDGGKIKDYADASVIVPERETYKIQELHLPVYHTLCLMLEDYFFS